MEIGQLCQVELSTFLAVQLFSEHVSFYTSVQLNVQNVNTTQSFTFLTLRLLRETKSTFAESVIQNETAQYLHSDLDTHCPTPYEFPAEMNC